MIPKNNLDESRISNPGTNSIFAGGNRYNTSIASVTAPKFVKPMKFENTVSTTGGDDYKRSMYYKPCGFDPERKRSRTRKNNSIAMNLVSTGSGVVAERVDMFNSISENKLKKSQSPGRRSSVGRKSSLKTPSRSKSGKSKKSKQSPGRSIRW